MHGKKSVFYEKISQTVYWTIRGIEILLAGLLVLLVLASSIFVFGTLIQNYSQIAGFSDFQQLLSYLLLLIIALELAYMLIEHTPNNVVEVMIYAIARKMLIYNTTALDLLVGVITLAILFGVKVYLIKDRPGFLKSKFFKKMSSKSKNKV
ncbi:MAG TPA: hypothetical protein GXZ50_02655 [Clostridia bacterium]|jgi:hypothetical protein|nr:hypothetical protein [Clostridia bacterium]